MIKVYKDYLNDIILIFINVKYKKFKKRVWNLYTTKTKQDTKYKTQENTQSWTYIL